MYKSPTVLYFHSYITSSYVAQCKYTYSRVYDPVHVALLNIGLRASLKYRPSSAYVVNSSREESFLRE